jgi:hypothetical protein
MNKLILLAICLFLSAFHLHAENPSFLKVDGTTGTPLGGVGTGAVKYCAWTGILNAFTDMTPAGMQRYNKEVNLA